MKKNLAKLLKRSLALTVAVCALVTLCASCSAKAEVPDPVLECGDEKLPLYFYEFMLSRMKGSLARNKYPVKDSSFWYTEIEETGQTYAEYYNESIFESCKKYFASAVLFDEMGLTLPESTLAAIDEEVAFYVDYDGDGDQSAFDELISPFGVDTESLRECYIIEAKYEYLLAHLFGGGKLIADSVREEYFQKNYYCFKQVLLAKFYYKYQQDKYGNTIYFDKETKKPLYDTEKGSYAYDENGARIRDSFGQPIYFDAQGNVVYDKENGIPRVVLDQNGNPIQYECTDGEIAANESLAKELAATLTEGNFSEFESEIKENVLVVGAVDEYADGYYLSQLDKAGYVGDVAYLSDILDMLKEMEVGEIGYYESDAGFHVIMKYALETGKYTEEEYKDWFSALDSHIINDLFNIKIADTLSKIKINEENFAKARSIADLGINYDY
ncbi:MAG: hypothetical protein E7592_05680 [Ruminococcaceae bacterium]|nr:hypothetical protein [Oscillospiraceae bacterium]